MRFKELFSPAVALLVASTIAATAFAADATGTWTWTTKSKKGKEIESTLTLKAEGDKLTGEVTRGPQQRSTEISNGTVKGDQVSFDVTVERNGSAQTTKFSGKVDGDTIKGTRTGSRKGGGVGRSREWEAKRSK